MNQQIKTRIENGIKVVELFGRFDAHVVPKVQAWLAEQNGESNCIIFNMESVNFIDTRALSLLVTTMKRCRQSDGVLLLCSLQQPVRIIFELTHLDKAFDIFEDEATAISTFFQSPVLLPEQLYS